MSDKQKQWLAYGVILVAVLVAGFLGVNYPLPAPPAVSVSGQSVSHMSGPLNLDDGSASAPAYGFTNDTDVGVYRVGANDLGVAVGGSKILDVSSTGITATNMSATTITATTLVSQAVGFSASAASSLVTTTINGALTITGTVLRKGALTYTGGTAGDYLTVTSPISMAGAAFTGPIVYGAATNVADSTVITHGLLTTPTAAFPWAAYPYTPSVVLAPITMTIRTSTTIPALFWFAGK